MKTGIQLTNAHPASSTCSTYHLVAISLPTGRQLTTPMMATRTDPTGASLNRRDRCDVIGESDCRISVARPPSGAAGSGADGNDRGHGAPRLAAPDVSCAWAARPGGTPPAWSSS